MMDLGLTLGDHCSKATPPSRSPKLHPVWPEGAQTHTPKILQQQLTDKLTDQTRHFKGKKSHRMKPDFSPQTQGTQRLLPAQGSASIRIPAQSTGDGSLGRT